MGLADRIAAGRPLVLGGVSFESPWGLDGHSDADVLLPCDAGDDRFARLHALLLLGYVDARLQLDRPALGPAA